jgi:hypothetical protein
MYCIVLLSSACIDMILLYCHGVDTVLDAFRHGIQVDCYFMDAHSTCIIMFMMQYLNKSHVV